MTTAERPPKNQIKDGWVCPKCGNLNYRDDDHCTDLLWVPSLQKVVETACGAPKPEWIDDE